LKRLLSGNEAFAIGAWEAGIKFASSYPGTPATEILENIAKFKEVKVEWAPNEKVALEAVIGASFSGVRAIASMKHVGLNVASDPFMTLSYTGVNGGIAIVVSDDPGLYSSQNEQDTRNYVRSAKIPALEPSDSQEAYEYIKLAFKISEEYDTPTLVRSTTRISHTKTVVEVKGIREEIQKELSRDPAKWVMLPAFAYERHIFVLERFKKLQALSEEIDLNRIEIRDRKLGFITSGVCYQYVKEAFPEASVLKLGMIYPLPKKKILEFSNMVDEIFVVEELDPFLETEIKAMGIEVKGKGFIPEFGELNVDVLKKALDKNYKPKYISFTDIPKRPPTLCPGCPHRGVFVALKRAKVFVFGDIGCYTLGALKPLSSMDSCICMGAGVSMVHGATSSGMKKVVAVIGDSTFLHTGINSLLDIAYNRSSSTVIILDNGTTAMTGRQPHPGTGEKADGTPTTKVLPEEIAKAFGIERIKIVDPYEIKKLVEVIKEEVEAEEPSVIITRAPCTLISRESKRPLKINEEKCILCKSCLNVGCMAIFYDGKKVSIDEVLCKGCTICAQVCPKEAIETP